MIKIEIRGGETISSAIDSLIKQSKDCNSSVFAIFNDIKIVVSPDSNKEFVFNKFKEDQNKLITEYLMSEEYIQKTKTLNKEQVKLQEKLNSIIQNEFPTSKSSKKDILIFLEKLQPYTDFIGLNVQVNKILNGLIKLGFKENVNCNELFKENDENNFADYIIGQAMDQLIVMNCIHPSVCIHIKFWMEKFD